MIDLLVSKCFEQIQKITKNKPLSKTTKTTEPSSLTLNRIARCFRKKILPANNKLRHSRTGMAKQMADALHVGASDALIEMEASTSDLHIEMLPARDAQVRVIG